MENDPWLEPWLSLIAEAAPSEHILELGCETGRDTKYLVSKGYEIAATDISDKALRECALNVPEAMLVKHDLRDPLPFPHGSFEVIVASLSLHYFDLKTTLEIFSRLYLLPQQIAESSSSCKLCK